VCGNDAPCYHINFSSYGNGGVLARTLETKPEEAADITRQKSPVKTFLFDEKFEASRTEATIVEMSFRIPSDLSVTLGIRFTEHGADTSQQTSKQQDNAGRRISCCLQETWNFEVVSLFQ